MCSGRQLHHVIQRHLATEPGLLPLLHAGDRVEDELPCQQQARLLYKQIAGTYLCYWWIIYLPIYFYRRIITVRVSAVMESLRRGRSVTADWRSTPAATPVATLASWPRNTSTQTRGMSKMSYCRYFVNLFYSPAPGLVTLTLLGNVLLPGTAPWCMVSCSPGWPLPVAPS